MKTFFALRNKDACDEYIAALLSGGYKEALRISDADFLLIDNEHKGARFESIKHYCERIPVFIYPHTPYAYWLWDGLYTPLPVACNFVVGNGAIMGMQAYGYPYRVEAVGFTGCKVKSFTPTFGKKLLFAPAHPFGDGSHASKQAGVNQFNAARFIAENINCFESVVVRYGGTIESNGLQCFIGTGAILKNVDVYKNKNIRRDALSDIYHADIVISCNTLGYLSVASGKPSVLYGYKGEDAGGRAGMVKNYNLYKSHFEYPSQLEDMNIEDILSMRIAINEDVEKWKSNNIGNDFDSEKFLSIVKEYV